MTDGRGKANRKLAFEARITLIALLGGLPALVAALALLGVGDYSARAFWTFAVVTTLFWLACAAALRERVVRPLQTLSNLLAALREEDYSIRLRGGRADDVLNDVFQEANALGRMLREQRLGALEATALLRTVMREIDVAVFTFDGEQRLCLVNRAGERLLAEPAERLLRRTASELGIAECLTVEPPQTVQMSFPGGAGRWGVRLTTFREKGLPHKLLVLTDMTRELREEELQAWKRLVRVLGHELNNSLTPIRSIAGSLRALLGQTVLPADWREDSERGLEVVSARAEALSRFMKAYTRLAKLPPPRRGNVDVAAWIRRAARLETRIPVEVLSGPELEIRGDGDQLDQLLINLLNNAADAALETGGGVAVGWEKRGAQVEVRVQDDGPGLANSGNLFVPFFTTKAGGTGIGLVLSRQIAEAHGGQLTLENRSPGPGCEARLRLPALRPL